MNLVHTSRPVVAARANWGRWVADCPYCPSALWVEPGSTDFVCGDCHSRAGIVWPDQETVYAIERLLMQRPNVVTRNWEPGETVRDLMVENAAHGIYSGIDAAPGDLVFSVDDGGIRVDKLPQVAGRPLRAVGA